MIRSPLPRHIIKIIDILFEIVKITSFVYIIHKCILFRMCIEYNLKFPNLTEKSIKIAQQP